MGEAQDDAAATAGGAPQREAGIPGDRGVLADGPAAGDLIEQIGAEIDRRLDARLAALRLTGAAATVTGFPPMRREAPHGQQEDNRERVGEAAEDGVQEVAVDRGDAGERGARALKRGIDAVDGSLDAAR